MFNFKIINFKALLIKVYIDLLSGRRLEGLYRLADDAVSGLDNMENPFISFVSSIGNKL